MSKELTEQWQNGTLKEGVYWCEITESPYVEQVHLPCCEDIVVEVLTPVPSYDEYNELIQKIHILNEANMKLENTVGKLCEQLKEANYAIKHYKYCSSGFKVDKEGSVIDKFIARSYLDKWGVK